MSRFSALTLSEFAGQPVRQSNFDKDGQPVTRASLLKSFFRHFLEVFPAPAEMPDAGWYSLASVARMLGYENVKAARKLVPESELGAKGRAVSETGIIYLALMAKPSLAAMKVGEVCKLTITDALFADNGSTARLYELCDEIRALLDRFAPQKRGEDYFCL